MVTNEAWFPVEVTIIVYGVIDSDAQIFKAAKNNTGYLNHQTTWLDCGYLGRTFQRMRNHFAIVCVNLQNLSVSLTVLKKTWRSNSQLYVTGHFAPTSFPGSSLFLPRETLVLVLFPTCVLLPCLSPQFAFYFLLPQFLALQRCMSDGLER